MDGQVAAIRDGLDAAGHTDVVILAYAAKFASAFYGPFREAVTSSLSGDRRTYQQDPGNVREALREIELDLDEGADIVMVKPAMGYLDVVAAAADVSPVPVAAYQVSGEYAMICAAAANGWIDERAAALESLTEHPARRRRYRADLLGRGCGGLAFVTGEMGLQMTSRGGEPKPLFYESGASWLWVALGPLSAAALILIEVWSGAPVSFVVPVIFLVMVSAFVALQVKAARIHVSVELTQNALRQGTETVLVREIVKVYPEPENHVASGQDAGEVAVGAGARRVGRGAARTGRASVSSSPEVAPRRPGRVVIATFGRR